jgi:hypothetical protein
VRKTTAVAGSAVFLVIAPGVVAGLVPWWLTGWQAGTAYPVPVRIAGAVLIVAGAAALLGAFAQFAVEGQGMPAPPAPTDRGVLCCPIHEYCETERLEELCTTISDLLAHRVRQAGRHPHVQQFA